MAHTRKEPKSKTSLIISVVVHAVVISVIFYWAAKTGLIPESISKAFKISPTKKPEKPKEKPPEPPKQTKADLKPPTATDLPPPPANVGPSVKMADPNALAARGDNPFAGAAVREPGAAPAAVVQAQGTMGGTGKPATTPTATRIGPPPISGAPPSMFTKESARPSSIASVLEQRKASSAMQDIISSEQISKSGVSDAAEVVGKATGVTIVDGKYAVVRGLADRYTSTTMNGAEVPTADPYRKAVQLDIVPASMIDSVSVTKTFTPDQPGGFTGGAVNVVTKSFPDKFTFTGSAGMGYNTQATGNGKFLTSQGGKYDWAARDDGFRALPASANNVRDVATTFGNGAYVTPTSPTPEQIAETEQNAIDYSDFQKSFGNRQLGPVTKTPGYNQNYGFSLGDTVLVGTKRLGFFTGLSYEHKYNFYEGQVGRVELPGLVAAGQKPNGKKPGKPTVVQNLKDTRGTEENSWGAVANVALELFEGHEVAFTYVHTQSAEDVARRKIGQASKVNAADGVDAYLNELHWTERNLTSYQFRGRHDFRGLLPLQLDWLHSIATTTQDEPDYRLFNFTRNTNSGALVVDASSGVPDPANGPTRYYRNLKEENHTTKLDFTIPVSLWGDLQSKLKFGTYASESEREFRERGFTFKPSTSSGFGGNPLTFPNRFITDQQLGYSTTTNRDRRGNLRNLIYQNATTVDDTLARSGLKGTQNIEAVYLMGEVPLFSQLKLIGGARWESTELRVNSFSALEGKGTNKIEQTDLLPAAGLVFEIITNMNLRLNWGRTVARPTFREFSRLRSYDPTGDDIFIGNPGLKMSGIENYDARWEWFRRPGEVLSVGVFYKDILKPIERITVDAATLDRYSYTNFPKAKVFGFELEARSSLDFLDVALSNFSAGVNFAWIKSETENTKQIIQTKGERGVYEQTRPLFDQSPYVLNADISWSSAWLGSSITLSYNVAGERLYLVNNLGFDIYEQPAPQLDLVYSQRLGKHWKLKFSAKNLLDPDYKRIYGQAGDLTPERIYSSHTKGRTFGISLGCEF